MILNRLQSLKRRAAESHKYLQVQVGQMISPPDYPFFQEKLLLNFHNRTLAKTIKRISIVKPQMIYSTVRQKHRRFDKCATF